jgi:hypothetical protein
VHVWALFNRCCCPFWVCPGRQLWSGTGEWTPEALSTNSRFGIRAWHSRCIGTQIFEDEIMSWEWALKFPTLKLWVWVLPNSISQGWEFERPFLSQISVFDNMCPRARECQPRTPNRELVLSASGVHSPGPHQSCRIGHTQSPVHRRGR